MAQNPPEGVQRIIPMLVYRDAPAAIEFLCKALGFKENFRLEMDDGAIGHCELEYQGHIVMLASEFPSMNLVSPQDLPGRHSQVMLYVDDVDAHHERARAAGATITQAVADQSYGDRNYRLVDPEGGRWMISMRVKDVAPEDMLGSS